jgi:hypothetical protein
MIIDDNQLLPKLTKTLKSNDIDTKQEREKYIPQRRSFTCTYLVYTYYI